MVEEQVEVMSRMAATLEPPAFVSQAKSYAIYKRDLKMWSRITKIQKK